ncbi:MAG: hypothetical protein H0W63_02290 [Gemmatimonadaceae bacterium]|nr:hypothetical protein [Gemmatimonadaceae bacterium]
MNRRALAVFGLIALSCAESSARSLSGRWLGKVSANGADSPITIDFVQEPRGPLRALASLQEETLWTDYALSNVRVAGSKLKFEVPSSNAPNAVFTGVINGDSITGTIVKGAHAVRVGLVRSGLVPAKPYSIRKVRYRSADGTELAGDILTPHEGVRRPGVVLLHGSGAHTRDDLRFYADLFARHGMVALIGDKRRSHSDGTDYTYFDLADDADASIALLAADPSVDDSRIGIFGVSEGGWVAPIVAARNSRVGFVIALVASGMSYAENEIYQRKQRWQAAGASPGALATFDTTTRALHDFARRLKGGRKIDDRSRAELQASLDHLAAVLGPRLGPPAKMPLATDTLSLRWRMLDFDPVTYWKHVKQPVLFVWGANDRNVDTESSRKRILTALIAAANNDVTALTYNGVEHDLMIKSEGRKFFFPHPPPGYPDTLVKWLTRTTGAKSGAKARLVPE